MNNVFKQATVTLQGSKHNDITGISGSPITLGARVSGRLISSTSVRLGTKTKYPLRGSGHSPSYKYLRNTSALTLKHYGDTTLYVAPSVGAKGISHDWYYVDSGGTSYYTSAGSGYYIGVDSSSDKLYESDGSSPDAYPVVSSGGTLYYTPKTSSNVYYYPVDADGTEYYRAGVKETGLYNAGTVDSTTYYTKS